jgi:hypothetical protein
MTEKIVEKDETIPELPAKDLVRKYSLLLKSSQRLFVENALTFY